MVVKIEKMFGRLGNRLFQMATLIALASETESDIYFQDLKWFEKYEDKIRDMFGAGIGEIDKVAIHVRRGDYLLFSHQYPNLMETDYYVEAMKEFEGKKFIVFSDDIEWCKQQDIFNGCEFSEGNNEVQDLNIMASCLGIITANSSYSWWAAFLGSKDKKVICPRQDRWGTPITLKDNWKQI